jgi:DNA primase
MNLSNEQRAALLRDYLVSKGVRINSSQLGWQKVSCYGSGHVRGDRSPSASANLRTGYYKCFACDLQGDAIALVMAEKGVDFKSALAMLGQVGASGNIEIKEVETWI